MQNGGPGADRAARSAQRNFEDRLGQTIGELDASHKARSAALEASMLRVHGDMHRLASGLLDVAMGMQRLEGKLDRLCEAAARDGEPRLAAQQTAALPVAGAGARRAAEGDESEHHRDSAGPGAERGTGANSSLGAARVETESRISRSAGDSEKAAPAPPKEAAQLPASGATAGAEVVPWQSGRNLCNGSLAPESGGLQELDSKFGAMDKKLDRIAAAVGVKSVGNEGDDEADRKRLKEKLKVAIELDRRSRIRTIVSKSEVWLEYFFGICSPDQRIGKRGSR